MLQPKHPRSRCCLRAKLKHWRLGLVLIHQNLSRRVQCPMGTFVHASRIITHLEMCPQARLSLSLEGIDNNFMKNDRVCV
jgi:hypothetical protein